MAATEFQGGRGPLEQLGIERGGGHRLASDRGRARRPRRSGETTGTLVQLDGTGDRDGSDHENSRFSCVRHDGWAEQKLLERQPVESFRSIGDGFAGLLLCIVRDSRANLRARVADRLEHRRQRSRRKTEQVLRRGQAAQVVEALLLDQRG